MASLAHWWLARLAEGFAAERALGPNASSVRFEDFVQGPEDTLRTLCGDLGLTYRDAMLTSGALHVTHYTRGQHQFVGRPPDPSRVTAWHTALSPREQEVFEHLAGDALRLLGYDRRFIAPRPASRLERLKTWLIHNPLRRRWVKHLRQKRRAALLTAGKKTG